MNATPNITQRVNSGKHGENCANPASCKVCRSYVESIKFTPDRAIQALLKQWGG